jgi:hypothetical protein
MRRHRLDLVILFVLMSGTCLFVSLSIPSDRRIAVHVWVLSVGALAMLALVSAVGAAVPRSGRSELARALHERTAEPAQVSELAKIEREVTLAVGNAYDLHARLLPRLREIAEARLEQTGRRGGPETLGRWWELLRPDRAEPQDRFAPGIGAAELRELVADLERM